jgi:RNA-directed DNA polymerase
MVEAWKRDKANKGSAGVDGLTIDPTVEHLKTHWPDIPADCLARRIGRRPFVAWRFRSRQVARESLGSTVTDGPIRQALLQVLRPLNDSTFSEFSYGFRPGRSAHRSVLQAQRYAREGYQVVVDVELEKFFDRATGLEVLLPSGEHPEDVQKFGFMDTTPSPGDSTQALPYRDDGPQSSSPSWCTS